MRDTDLPTPGLRDFEHQFGAFDPDPFREFITSLPFGRIPRKLLAASEPGVKKLLILAGNLSETSFQPTDAKKELIIANV